MHACTHTGYKGGGGGSSCIKMKAELFAHFLSAFLWHTLKPSGTWTFERSALHCLLPAFIEPYPLSNPLGFFMV